VSRSASRLAASTALLSGLAAAWAGAATLHVDPLTGSDLFGDGQASSPYRSVARALDLAGAGDTVLLQDGIYSRATQGGDAKLLDWMVEVPGLTLAAAPGATPVVDYAGVTIGASHRGISLLESADGFRLEGLSFRGWTHGHSLTAEHVELLGADDVVLRDCTWTACGGDFWTVRIRNVGNGSEDVRIEGCTFDGNADSWRPALFLEGDGGPGEERFVVSGCTFNDESDLALPEGGRPAILAGAVDSLLIEDTFGWNPGSIRTPTSNATDFIDVQGSSRVRIRGCGMIRYVGDWTYQGTDHPLHECDGVVLATGTHTAWIENCGFWGAGHGVEILSGSYDVRLRAVYTDSTLDDGIFIDATSGEVRVERCVIHHPWDDGIDVKGDDVTLRHNTIVRAYSSALSVWGSSARVDVRDCLVFDAIDGGPSTLAGHGSHGETAVEVSWDHDLYFSPDPDEGHFRHCDGLGCEIGDFSQWTGDWGHDPAGMWADPLLANPLGRAWPPGSDDFRLLPDSPARFAASDGTHIGALQDSSVDVSGSASEVATHPRILVTSPFRHRAVFRPTAASIPPDPGRVLIHDLGGRIVRGLDSDPDLDGWIWDGRDHLGREVPPGVYFFRWVDRSETLASGRVVRTP
jgi:hypothetical protein